MLDDLIEAGEERTEGRDNDATLRIADDVPECSTDLPLTQAVARLLGISSVAVFKKIKKSLKAPVIFDGRNLYDLEQMKEQGFHYESIGREIVS